MATYVISDIHGEYEQYMRLMEQIHFSSNDVLYVLGDILDRGPQPIKVLQEMMKFPNIIAIAGNHEVMGIKCLRFLLKEITEENISLLDDKVMNRMFTWGMNGCTSTVREFRKLDESMRKEVIDYIEEFSTYEEITVNETSYLLVHAGLGNFSPKRPIYEYHLDELVWERPNYEQAYFPDKYVITGHTPTQAIKSNPKKGYIYRANHHIAIDCGACFGGRLAALCLETGEEFYSIS